MKSQVFERRQFEHTRLLELGFIITLSLLIMILQGNKRFILEQKTFIEDLPVIDMKDIPQTTVEKKVIPPKPPSIPIPAENEIEVKGYDPNEFFVYDGLGSTEIPLPRDRVEDDLPFIVIFEKPPVPVGGFEAIAKNLVYPEIARKAGVEGRVTVMAYIDEEGRVVKTEILQSLGPNGCDEAAVNAINAVIWEPAMQRDRPVRVKIAIPIDFKLSNN